MPSPCVFVTCSSPTREHVPNRSRHCKPPQVPVACAGPTSQLPRRGAIALLLRARRYFLQGTTHQPLVQTQAKHMYKEDLYLQFHHYSQSGLLSSPVAIMPLPSFFAVNVVHFIPNPNASTNTYMVTIPFSVRSLSLDDIETQKPKLLRQLYTQRRQVVLVRGMPMYKKYSMQP